MKANSSFADAMNALQPQPARREAMLQNILAGRHAGGHHRLWAWVALPAAAALLLLLAWGGGAFTSRVAAPDVVTQEGTDTVMPSATPASVIDHTNTGKVQWLTHVTLASPDVANNLPDKLELVRSQPVLLPAEDMCSIENALKAKGWDTAQMLGINGGYYKLIAHKKTSVNQTTMDTFVQDSGLYHLAEQRGIRLSSDQPQDYSGLRLTLQPSSDPISISSDFDQNSVDTETIIAFWKDEIMGSVNALPLDQALRKAFYILGGHPALDAGTGLVVNSVNFVCVSGVPCYQFPVETANGTRYGYALAVDEKDLNALPKLAQTYQQFLNGEGLQIDVILQSPADVSDPNTNK